MLARLFWWDYVSLTRQYQLEQVYILICQQKLALDGFDRNRQKTALICPILTVDRRS
jgi:hypothetical protein